MRRQLFATAISAVLLFGATSPALAAGKALAKGHDKPAKTKPAKAPKTKGPRINGGGITVTGAEFSVQARTDHPKKANKGHFHYTKAATATSPEVKIRCKSVTLTPAVPDAGGKAATVSSDSCLQGSGKTAQKVSVSATFYDNPTGDRVVFDFSPADNGPIQGDIHVR